MRLAQLYGVFGCAELNGMFCRTSLSSGWLLFCRLFVFYQPDKLLLDVCWVCLLVCFLNRKFAKKDKEQGGNESVNH